jgi:hypothetical protein
MADIFIAAGGVFVVIGGLWTLISLFGSIIAVGFLFAGINMLAAGGILRRLDQLIQLGGSSTSNSDMPEGRQRKSPRV